MASTSAPTPANTPTLLHEAWELIVLGRLDEARRKEAEYLRELATNPEALRKFEALETEFRYRDVRK
jgi:hypothetical protein